MPVLSNNIPVFSAPAGVQYPTLASIVNSVTERLSLALAHTPRSRKLASRRLIERALGRNLDPLFALELLTLMLAQGSEARALRAAVIKLMSMTESREWLESLTCDSFARVESGGEAAYLASGEAAGAQQFARCGECLDLAAAERGDGLDGGAAANRQWALCAQCRCTPSD